MLWGHVAPAYVLCDEDIREVFTEPLVNANISQFVAGMGLSYGVGNECC